MSDWQPIGTAPEGVEVLTKISDADGDRNEQKLTRRGRLWWLPVSGGAPNMYVYYTPTHWLAAPTGSPKP